MNVVLWRLAVLFILLPPVSLHAQVTLQPWVEVYGTTNGEQLGKFVTGIVPTANLPFRAAVSKVGSTGIYRLNTPTDTAAQLRFSGENLLTGDLNNDGYKDVVVGRTVNNYDTVYVYWGTSTGVDTLNPLYIPGENQYDGLMPACIGDINNDGLSDLILSAVPYPHRLFRGKVYVYLGPVQSSLPNASLLGDSTLYQLGIRTAIRDLNDDGFYDLVLRGARQLGNQSTYYGYVNIYWGLGPDTLNLTLGLQVRTNVAAKPGLTCFDVNGDGKDDLVWAIQDSLATRINVHFGGSSFDTIPDLQLQNPGVGTFGSVITNGGDMNGDGYNDIVVGCPRASITSGVVLVYGGGPNIDRFVDAAASLGYESGFGTSVASLGDVSGDGLADIIVGAPHDPFFNDRGYWGIFKGDSAIRVTDVKETPTLPVPFTLEQAYPNPFNPSTTLGYVVRTSAHIALSVFDGLGRKTATLVDNDHSPGRYEANFDGRLYASGVYYCRLQAGKFVQTRKLMILR